MTIPIHYFQMKWLTLVLLFFPLIVRAEEVLSVAVIGSGPAGLGAALVTGREQIKTHVFLGNRPGGPLNAVTCAGNWPGATGKGNAVMGRLFDQLKRCPVFLHEEKVVKVDFSTYPFRLWTEEGNAYSAASIVIATGAFPRTLGVRGEAEYLGKGIQTALYKPDAPTLKGKKVAIVGGGIDATKKATIASKTAEHIYLIVRGPELQHPMMEKKIKKRDNITVFYESAITCVEGDGNQITHFNLTTPLGQSKLGLDVLILAAGIIPNIELFEGQLEFDSDGYILLEGRTQQTSILGVFAAGTATDARYRQAGFSVADGMKAGYDALLFLKQSVDVGHFIKRE